MGMLTKPKPVSLPLFLNSSCREKGAQRGLIAEVNDEILRIASGMFYSMPHYAERTKGERMCVGAPSLPITAQC